jgi:hypothetical protein
MNDFANEHELFEDDYNGEQFLDDSMFDDYEQDDMYDDGDALASAGWGTDEDYNGYCYDDY